MWEKWGKSSQVISWINGLNLFHIKGGLAISFENGKMDMLGLDDVKEMLDDIGKFENLSDYIDELYKLLAGIEGREGEVERRRGEGSGDSGKSLVEGGLINTYP